MPTQRVEFAGYLEIPAGVEVSNGYRVRFEGEGEVRNVSEKLTRKTSGESTITRTFTLTADPDETILGKFTAPTGPLEKALDDGEGGDDPEP